MDALKNAVGMGGSNQQNSGNQQGFGNQQNSMNQPTEHNQGGGGFLGGLGDKMNTAAGGGRESEKNEDYLDKGPSLLVLEHHFLRRDPSLFAGGCSVTGQVKAQTFASLRLFMAIFPEVMMIC